MKRVKFVGNGTVEFEDYFSSVRADDVYIDNTNPDELVLMYDFENYENSLVDVPFAITEKKSLISVFVKPKGINETELQLVLRNLFLIKDRYGIFIEVDNSYVNLARHLNKDLASVANYDDEIQELDKN